MVKFPTENKLMYAGATVSNGSFSQTHLINLARDCSIVNRRGYDMTTRKGVPLIYRVAATVYPGGLDGSGYTTSVSSDVRTTVKFLGAQNNWVSRNAAVKWHAAREKMFRDAGIKKKDRGAYSHTIRYSFASNGETLSVPVDGAGNAFNGGTWDTSDLSYEADGDFGLVLTGPGDDQESNDFTGTGLQFSHAYLLSRVNQQADTNLEAEEGPAEFSVLRKMLSPTGLADEGVADDVVDEARDAQDNPPYEVLDLSDSGDVNHDVTESIELGRLCMMPQGSGASLPQTVEFHVPFGIFAVNMCHRDPGDNSGITDDLALGLQVLDIYEMQG
uniref:Uncharacterized protein n=1 Tax=uncultured marine virus TaxID=186617 RepID=S4TDQ5_9VIRU|nr:hypothetical protein [uncultured marine virus]